MKRSHRYILEYLAKVPTKFVPKFELPGEDGSPNAATEKVLRELGELQLTEFGKLYPTIPFSGYGWRLTLKGLKALDATRQ